MKESINIALFGGLKKIENEKVVFSLLEEMKLRKINIFFKESFYLSFSKQLRDYIEKNATLFGPEIPENLDMVFSMGGDGTFLQTTSEIVDNDIPILGINLGSLGFLAEVSPSEIKEALNMIIEEQYKLEYRNLVSYSILSKDGIVSAKRYALNEISILRQNSGSMLTIHVYINDEFLNSYKCDGLLVATPTGSTAYSLSLGGPIMEPQIPGLIVAAMAPHTLNNRPMIVHDDSKIMLKVEGRSDCCLISADGRSEVLDMSNTIYIEKWKHKLNMIRLEGKTFFKVLREKLMWGADIRI